MRSYLAPSKPSRTLSVQGYFTEATLTPGILQIEENAMKSTEETRAMVFNIQRYSIEDGPGIRTTVFLKGCPLRCLWCSNPESQDNFPQLAHQDALCVGCGDCVKVCKEDAISVVADHEKFKIVIARAKCTNCGECVGECTAGALKMYGQVMSVDQVFDVVMRDCMYYRKSGGGVTASGGEPLSQAAFVAKLFNKLREVGIHTAIDTSGHSDLSTLQLLASEVDLFLFDLKLMNRQQHRRYTGKYNDMILRNAQWIVDNGIPMIIRIPLIPGINDSEENLDETARFVSRLDKKLHVDLLPYHRLGLGKYEMLDRDYALRDTEYLTEEQLHKSIGVFHKYGLECEIQ